MINSTPDIRNTWKTERNNSDSKKYFKASQSRSFFLPFLYPTNYVYNCHSHKVNTYNYIITLSCYPQKSIRNYSALFPVIFQSYFGIIPSYSRYIPLSYNSNTIQIQYVYNSNILSIVTYYILIIFELFLNYNTRE